MSSTKTQFSETPPGVTISTRPNVRTRKLERSPEDVPLCDIKVIRSQYGDGVPCGYVATNDGKCRFHYLLDAESEARLVARGKNHRKVVRRSDGTRVQHIQHLGQYHQLLVPLAQAAARSSLRSRAWIELYPRNI